MRPLLWLLVSALLLPSAAVAGEKKGSGPKMVCQRSEHTVGTRLGGGRRKICRTQEEWQQEKQDAADFVNNWQQAQTQAELINAEVAAQQNANPQ